MISPAVLSQAATGWNTFTNDLNTNRSVVSTWYSSADTQSAISDLKTMAQTRQLTSKTWADLDSMHASLVTAATQLFLGRRRHDRQYAGKFLHFLVSFGADADIVSTFDGGMGFAIKTKNNVQDYRFTADLSVGRAGSGD